MVFVSLAFECGGRGPPHNHIFSFLNTFKTVFLAYPTKPNMQYGIQRGRNHVDTSSYYVVSSLLDGEL